MTTEWTVGVDANGTRLYLDESADPRHMTKDIGLAHVFTTKPVAEAVARMNNELVMDAILSGAVIPNIRFKVYDNN